MIVTRLFCSSGNNCTVQMDTILYLLYLINLNLALDHKMLLKCNVGLTYLITDLKCAENLTQLFIPPPPSFIRLWRLLQLTVLPEQPVEACQHEAEWKQERAVSKSYTHTVISIVTVVLELSSIIFAFQRCCTFKKCKVTLHDTWDLQMLLLHFNDQHAN